MGGRLSLVIAAAIAALSSSFAVSGSAVAGTVTLRVCDSPAAPLNQSPTGWSSAATKSPFSAVDDCQGGGRMQISVRISDSVKPGLEGEWATTLPAGMSLTSMDVPAQMGLINPVTQNEQGKRTGGFNARYVWSGGSVEVPVGTKCCGGMDYARATSRTISGRSFAIEVECDKYSGEPGGDCIYGDDESPQVFDVKNFTLTALDDTRPTLGVPATAGTGRNLWDAGAWVRGTFMLAFTAVNASGSGVCATGAYLDGRPLSGGSVSPVTDTQWLQCDPNLGFSNGIDTTTLTDGEHSLALGAIDAASPANHSSPASRSFGVDNVAPTVGMPTAVDISGNGSTSYVKATATAGPSGVRDIICSDNGQSAGSYVAPAGETGFSAQIPVSGLGTHELSCVAQNNAVSSAGTVATSTRAVSKVSLREPTVARITFAKVVDRERCSRTRHGRRVCRVRTIRRRVTVIVRRHGKKVKAHRVVRVAVLPHVIDRSRERGRYGHRVAVSGVIGAGGGALAGVTVRIFAAPQNGSGRYRRVGTATTNRSGAWKARVPAGPSRLIRAAYGGSSTTEPAISKAVRVTVPARIRIASIRPRELPWGSTIRITGVLSGGYLPPGGETVELRYRYGHDETVYGVKTHVTTRRFSTEFTFGPGQTPLTFGFQIATLPAADYPYAPAASNTVDVRVGKRPHPR